MRRSYRQRKHRRTTAVLVFVLGLFAQVLAPDGAASQTGRPPIARAAYTLDGTDSAHLHLAHEYEATLYEEGYATGAAPGYLRAQLKVGATFTGWVTIYTRGGSIIGYGSAKPHGEGRYQSFGGSLTVTRGTGRYAHIHGHGGLYGTFDRRTYAVVVQTTGNFYY
jgi:hypothetical protein